MKMNAGTWIGIIGAVIGILVAVIAVIVTAGSMGIYIGIGMVVLFGGMFYLFYRLFFKPLINASRLQKTGLPGMATILEVRDTGVTINNNPQAKLILEIKNSFGQKYTAETRVLVSRLNPGVYVAGMQIPVKIDPNNEKNVVPDFAGKISPTGATNYLAQPNADVMKEELEQLQKENNVILVSGKPARAIIKKLTPLGVNVNGNNPYVELDLEVLPDIMPSFSGKAKGVIAEASLPKYQPGCTVFVKYDLYDNSKVVIDHA
jgi:hypothetical protein